MSSLHTQPAVLDAIGQHGNVDTSVEVTLEANPTSVEATRFRGFRAAGVNRAASLRKKLRAAACAP